MLGKGRRSHWGVRTITSPIRRVAGFLSFRLLSILNRSLVLSLFLVLHAVLFARQSARFDRIFLQPLSIPVYIVRTVHSLGNAFDSRINII